MKQRLEKILQGNRGLNEEVSNAQEQMRLSAGQMSKLRAEISEMKQRLNSNNTETETYRKKIQKLTAENAALGEEMRGAQENLRLSAGTISKLNNELKITCNENEDLKKQLEEVLKYKVR